VKLSIPRRHLCPRSEVAPNHVWAAAGDYADLVLAAELGGLFGTAAGSHTTMQPHATHMRSGAVLDNAKGFVGWRHDHVPVDAILNSGDARVTAPIALHSSALGLTANTSWPVSRSRR
jgi:hypothetical protein